MGLRAQIGRVTGTAAALAAALVLCGCSAAAFKSLAPLPGKQPQAAAEAKAPARESQGISLLAFAAGPERTGPAHVNGLISRYAAQYDVPESLVHRLVKKESGYNANARNGPYYGLMQISHATARSMGYRGDPSGLLDPDTNLRYAVKYLRGAWIVGGYNEDAAMRHYQRGYYDDAKRRGLLKEAGLR